MESTAAIAKYRLTRGGYRNYLLRIHGNVPAKRLDVRLSVRRTLRSLARDHADLHVLVDVERHRDDGSALSSALMTPEHTV